MVRRGRWPRRSDTNAAAGGTATCRSPWPRRCRCALKEAGERVSWRRRNPPQSPAPVDRIATRSIVRRRRAPDERNDDSAIARQPIRAVGSRAHDRLRPNWSRPPKGRTPRVRPPHPSEQHRERPRSSVSGYPPLALAPPRHATPGIGLRYFSSPGETACRRSLSLRTTSESWLIATGGYTNPTRQKRVNRRGGPLSSPIPEFRQREDARPPRRASAGERRGVRASS
jgi:hypothetical protein